MIKIIQGDKEADFIHIPKTGGSAVTQWLKHHFKTRPLNEINSRSMSHIFPKYILGLSENTFGFTRDCISWHQSLYKMIIDYSDNHQKTDFKGTRGRMFNPVGIATFFYAPSFNGFIQNILDHAPDYYTEVMNWYVPYCVKVGEHSKLERDLKSILKEFGFDVPDAPLPKVGVRNKNLDTLSEDLKNKLLTANGL